MKMDHVVKARSNEKSLVVATSPALNQEIFRAFLGTIKATPGFDLFAFSLDNGGYLVITGPPFTKDLTPLLNQALDSAEKTVAAVKDVARQKAEAQKGAENARIEASANALGIPIK